MAALGALAKDLDVAVAEEAPEASDESEAAADFLAAIRANDPDEVAATFKQLKRACEAAYVEEE
jgi:hypothetical protein